MSIHFTCPHCGTTTNADPWYAGLSGPCAICERTVTVPGEAADGISLPHFRLRANGTRSVATVVGIVLAALLASATVVGLLVALCAPLFFAAQARARDATCRDHLKRIAAAMDAYHQQYGCFPPAFVADQKGRPMHSWRVLILPYLGHDSLYRQYDFSKPWNAPENLALETFMPAEFGCPGDPSRGACFTSYLAVTGPGTLFEGTTSKSLDDVMDDPDTTIPVTERPESEVSWLEPVDIDVREWCDNVYGGSDRLSGVHGNRGNVATVSGQTRTLDLSVSAAQIRALASIAGGEPIADDVLQDKR